MSDSSTVRPSFLKPTIDGEGGRGLRIVAELSIAHGAVDDEDGKTIWFELSRGATAAGPA